MSDRETICNFTLAKLNRHSCKKRQISRFITVAKRIKCPCGVSERSARWSVFVSLGRDAYRRKCRLLAWLFVLQGYAWSCGYVRVEFVEKHLPIYKSTERRGEKRIVWRHQRTFPKWRSPGCVRERPAENRSLEKLFWSGKQMRSRRKRCR